MTDDSASGLGTPNPSQHSPETADPIASYTATGNEGSVKTLSLPVPVAIPTTITIPPATYVEPMPWYRKALPDAEEFIKTMPEDKLREGATIAYSAAKSYMDFLRLCMEGIDLVKDLLNNPVQEAKDGDSDS